MSEWIKYSLDDLLDDLLDRRGVTPLKLGSDFSDHGHRVISAKLIKSRRIDLDADEARFVDDETYARWMKTPLLPDDVILTSEAPLGETAYVSERLDWCLGQRLFALRPRKDRLVGRYLFYALQSASVIADLQSRATGTTAQGIRQSQLRKVLVPTPPLRKQHTIANILGVLDDKIELNRRMNETLEAMARAIFQSWFADFDPVYAKTSEFIAEGILAIGDGYRAKNDELGTEGVPFIRAAELNNGFDTIRAERLRLDRLPAAKGKQAQIGDVAFTSKGTVGRFARVGEFTELFVYSPQICYWRSLRPDVIHPAVLYCWMQSDEFISQIDGVAGQTDMAPYVSLRDQKAMKVPRFHDSQQQLGEQISPLLRMISEKQDECRKLAALRDALLPKLLSGELFIQEMVAA